jgi:16S rRNA (cytidine1402-2'-O)-methyltransferase
LTILGFAPSKANDRRRWLSDVSGIESAFTFFESPHRIVDTLRDAAQYFGERPIMVGRELTKAHQEFLRGTAATVLQQLEHPRGEFTVVVGPAISEEIQPEMPDDHVVAAEFGDKTKEGGLGRREAVAAVARKYGRPTREIYAAIERAKESGN